MRFSGNLFSSCGTLEAVQLAGTTKGYWYARELAAALPVTTYGASHIHSNDLAKYLPVSIYAKGITRAKVLERKRVWNARNACQK